MFRKERNPNIDRHLLEIVGEEIKANNPFANAFTMMLDEMERQEQIARAQGLQIPEIRLIFKKPGQNLDQNRYNIPQSNEVAVVFVPGADNEAPQTNIAVRQGGELRLLPSSDPLIDRLVGNRCVTLLFLFRFTHSSFLMVNRKDGVRLYVIH